MKFHPDVLSCHAEFGGDLEDMQRRYDAWPERKIITSNIYPPIPIRDFDWRAWFDDDGEEAGRYGYGRTEAEAKRDLLENYGEDGA